MISIHYQYPWYYLYLIRFTVFLSSTDQFVGFFEKYVVFKRFCFFRSSINCNWIAAQEPRQLVFCSHRCVVVAWDSVSSSPSSRWPVLGTNRRVTAPPRVVTDCPHSHLPWKEASAYLWCRSDLRLNGWNICKHTPGLTGGRPHPAEPGPVSPFDVSQQAFCCSYLRGEPPPPPPPLCCCRPTLIHDWYSAFARCQWALFLTTVAMVQYCPCRRGGALIQVWRIKLSDQGVRDEDMRDWLLFDLVMVGLWGWQMHFKEDTTGWCQLITCRSILFKLGSCQFWEYDDVTTKKLRNLSNESGWKQFVQLKKQTN